jgi:ferredoxin
LIRVRFVSADGIHVREVDAAPGERLLDVAQADGQPLEGTCDGQMACSTCHIIVDAADAPKLTAASEEEEDMLDLAVGTTRHSRLACQIRLESEWESLTVRVPASVYDVRVR